MQRVYFSSSCVYFSYGPSVLEGITSKVFLRKKRLIKYVYKRTQQLVNAGIVKCICLLHLPQSGQDFLCKDPFKMTLILYCLHREENRNQIYFQRIVLEIREKEYNVRLTQPFWGNNGVQMVLKAQVLGVPSSEFYFLQPGDIGEDT